MSSAMHERELKKGSAELLVLSLVQRQPRHGYEICKLIEIHPKGDLNFNVDSFYPLVDRLEHRGCIAGQLG